jgi:hypothetical protein
MRALSHLRLLAAKATEQRSPASELVLASTSLYAVANAYVTLGLLGRAEADGVLSPVVETLRSKGPGSPQLSVAAAHDYWQLRSRGPDGLSWVPRSVAVGPLRLVQPAAELTFDWLRLSLGGVRLQVEAIAAPADPSRRHAARALADVALTDSTGTEYQMYWDSGSGNHALWFGEAVATPAAPREVSWFEMRTRGSDDRKRVVVRSPRPIGVGTYPPDWPTPAESYLALFWKQEPDPATGEGSRSVVAAVAEALLVAAAIPSQSPLLPRTLGRQKRSLHPELPTTWPSAVRRPTKPDVQIALGALLPFGHAAVVIEGLSAWGGDVQLHVYGWPWAQAERWPMTIPSFTVRAFDDLGGQHDGRLGGFRDYGGGEGHGDFTFWPAVGARVRTLHVVVSTLWESAWADIDIQREAR